MEKINNFLFFRFKKDDINAQVIVNHLTEEKMKNEIKL
jgi:hypothetical protein